MRKNRLTGNFYHKQTIFGLVLMVGYYKTISDFPGDESPDIEVFRKATQKDLFKIKFGNLKLN